MCTKLFVLIVYRKKLPCLARSSSLVLRFIVIGQTGGALSKEDGKTPSEGCRPILKGQKFVLQVLILVVKAYFHSYIKIQGWMQTEWVETIKFGLSWPSIVLVRRSTTRTSQSDLLLARVML